MVIASSHPSREVGVWLFSHYVLSHPFEIKSRRHHPFIFLFQRRARSRALSVAFAPARTRGVRLVLPCEIRIGLVSEDFPDQARRVSQVEALGENLDAGNPDLAPALCDQCVDRRAVDVLAEASPTDGGRALRLYQNCQTMVAEPTRTMGQLSAFVYNDREEKALCA